MRILVLISILAASTALPLPTQQGSTLSHKVSLRGPKDLPHFSWTIGHPERAQGQSAYQINVFSPSGELHWTSGKVQSSNTHLVPYAGPALQPGSTYTWNVQWWDMNGIAAAQHKVAGSFISNIGDDWEGSKWINAGLEQALLRKEFQVDQSVKSAYLYVTGMGFMDMYVNGKLVSDYFGNGWTTFRKRLLYTVYDVSGLIQSGDNAMGAMVSRGWADWDAFPSRTGGDVFGPPTIRTVLYLNLANGTTVSVVSDETWTYDRAPVTYSSIYNGETYDARLEQDGWAEANFNPPFYGFWLPVKVVDSPTALVSRMTHPPIQVLETFQPVEVTQPKNGTYVVKFPHNISGMIRLRLSGKRGHVVTIRHAEILNHPPYADSDGMIYTDNLRSAKATDVYTLRGHHADEVYSPRHTYHGFQFVEITGYPGELTADKIEALFVATAVLQRSTLQFSTPVLTNLQERAARGQRANMMSVPTDCPQRDERLGWMGDANLSAESFFLNFDVADFFANYLRLIRDEQGDDGAVPDVVPCARYASRPGDPAWAGAYPTLAWCMYRFNGDLTAVEEQAQGLEAYIRFLDGQEKQTGLVNFYASYGDWCPPPPMPRASIHLTAAYSYIKSVRQMAELEAALGNKRTSSDLSSEVKALAAEFEQAYWLNKTMDIGVQTDMSIGLDIVMPDAPTRSTLAKQLIHDIVETNNVHMTTGIIGAKVMLPVLSKLGRNDVAFDVASQITYPSWGYMQYNPIEQADTIWELLDAPVEGPGMNSRNHHMFSSVSAWLHYLAGLEQEDGPKGAGFNHLRLVPKPMPGLSSASITIETPKGEASLSWNTIGGTQCNRVAENTNMVLDCGAGGVIKSIQASFGVPTGACAVGFKPSAACHSNSSQSIVHDACVGQQKCTVDAATVVFGDPCPNQMKVLIASAVCSNKAKLNATTVIPTGASATVQLPTLGHPIHELDVYEGGSLWFKAGRFVGNDAGVFGAQVTDDGVAFELGSGSYDFTVQPRGE